MSAHQWTEKLDEAPGRPFLLKFETYQAIAKAIKELQTWAITSMKGATTNTTVVISNGEATISGTGGSELPTGGTDGQMLVIDGTTPTWGYPKMKSL